MEQGLKDKLNIFYKRHKNLVYALNNWIAIKNKGFKLIDALASIYQAAGGKETVMTNMIEQLTAKNKVRGRSQVYADQPIQGMDIIRNGEGNLEVTGFSPDKEEPISGPSIEPNPRIFRKEDGQVKKTYQKAENRLYDIGAGVRSLYPDADKNFLLRAIKAVSDYSVARKKKPTLIIQRLRNRKLMLDTNTFEIKPTVKEGRVIIISEEVMQQISKDFYMNDYVFESNIRQFIFDLMNDPINAQPSETLKFYNLDRNTLLKYLKDYGIITKKEKISNKDENGDPKKPSMKVSYGRVPEEGDFDVKKKKFKLKVKQLYIDLFEKNVPEEINEEEGGFISGGGDMGQFSAPVFTEPVRQKSNHQEEVDEATTTTTVGDYMYDMPAFSDKETRDRKGGKNHSVSVNFK